MRVVAGTARGRRLQAPKGHDIRPTSDRVREAIFNTLWSLGAVEDAAVADLFAGTGALGIEALSRGAASAVFVDADRAAVATIRANLAATGFGASATVVQSDVLRWAQAAVGGPPFDVVLADPPYAFDRWAELFDLLAAQGVGLVVAEGDRKLTSPDGWEVLREKSYGTTVVHVLKPSSERP